MRRVALLSDVHGNLPALDAVLADIDASGIEERYCLGDLVGYGPDPAGVVDRMRELGIPCLQGNYDEGVGTRRGDCGCYFATEQARLDGDVSYAFTVAAIDDDRAAWLADLPPSLRLTENALRVLLTHGSPRSNREYLQPDRPEPMLERLAADAFADVVCFGHVHLPYHRRIKTADSVVHYVSVGSVGKPKDGDPRASWVELALDGDEGISASVNRVPYDVESVANAMLGAGLPPTLAEALRSAS